MRLVIVIREEFEVQNIIEHKSPMFRGNLWRYVYTLFGMDGYLSQNVTTYYILGEWFTGAIILLYILFPLILRFLTKNDKFVFLVTLILYVIFLDKPIINPVSYWSITSCLISFVCGMMLMRYREQVLNKWCALVSTIGFLVLWFVTVPLSVDVSIHLMGIFLFVILSFAGKHLMKNNFFDKIFAEMSSISYACFLLQHITIYEVLGAWNPSNPVKILILLVCTIVLILCKAKVLTLVTDAFVKKMDSIILRCLKNKDS